MNSPTGIQLILIGIGAFILIRVLMGKYAKAFERDRKLGRFVLSPFTNDTPKQPGEKYTAKDKMHIAAGILFQVTLLIIFIAIIDT